MSKKKTGDFMSNKGYYIALVLCAVAIGITGYLYYRNAETDNPQLSDSVPVASGNMQTPDVQAVATGPAQQLPNNTNPSDSTVAPTEGKKPVKKVRPVDGTVLAPYSMEALSYNETTRDWRIHNGMDIAAEAGTQVCAAADGTVYTVYEDDTMGTTVVISHDAGYTTRYSSLDSAVQVKAGDAVEAGQVIGKVGNTALLETAIGDHLHFSVSCDGSPVDPEEFLN